MITLKFSDRDEWLFARKGRVTGTRLNDLIVRRGTEKKIGFWQILAERLSTDPEGAAFGYETPMERGTRLEPSCVEKFVAETKKRLSPDLVIWARDENESIAISPDRVLLDERAALECKCLSSAHHIAAATKKFYWRRPDFECVPSEYEEQIVQYFCVNDELERVYMGFYDPRIVFKPFFYLTIERKDVQDKVDEYLSLERKEVKEIDEITNFFSMP